MGLVGTLSVIETEVVTETNIVKYCYHQISALEPTTPETRDSVAEAVIMVKNSVRWTVIMQIEVTDIPCTPRPPLPG
jgi:hypothetical protein